ncbi:MAG: hypothetical protein M1449_02545, partial [Candidatus Thermoplasmatota archaeon]|nr:hypothetical protein [Candidatus Thermoplasmatota archaeon]
MFLLVISPETATIPFSLNPALSWQTVCPANPLETQAIPPHLLCLKKRKCPMSAIRPAAVAGMFYPDDPAR